MELTSVESEKAFVAVLAELGASDPGKARLLADEQQVREEHFSDAALKAVFRAVYELCRSALPTDPKSVLARLGANSDVSRAGGAGWVYELCSPTDAWLSAAPTYAAAIRDFWLRRKMVEVAKRTLDAANNPATNLDKALGESTGAFAGLTRGSFQIKTGRDCLDNVLKECDEAARGKGNATIPTGIRGLDALIGGLQPTLTVIGAMPAVGKSALLATIVQRLSKRGVKLGFFSLEDEAEWLAWRMLADESGVNQWTMRNCAINKDQADRITSGGGYLWNYGANFLVDDRCGMTPSELVQSARDMVINKGCKAIIVDHLGELRLDGKYANRHDLEVEQALGELRSIAKEMHVPIVVAAHLRRRDGLTTETIPLLTDFANSASIERKARVALGLSRMPRTGELVVTVLKQTNGQPDFCCLLDFEGTAALVKDKPGEPVTVSRRDLEDK